MASQGLPRYSFAGDECIFVELSRDFDLAINFKIQAICESIMKEGIPGLIEAYPGTTTYLVHYNPEEIAPKELLKKLQNFDSKAAEFAAFESRLIEMPILYNDPWTVECAREFSSGHPDPSVTNLEFVAISNGLSVPEFIKAHTGLPYLITMKRFLPGSTACLQMVEKSRAMSCPKYLVPRKWSPIRSLVMGGVITSISPYGSPGGYQLLGRSAVPVYDPDRKLADLKDSVLARSGDRFKLRSIDMDEYEAIRVSVEAGDYRFKIVKQRFEPLKYFDNREHYLKTLENGLRDV
ncbi:MAG: carboxyltransferase domain-containing protein [Deltaproteobacteria bacterium]|nr:carboxyltransferase domain-containing protein [Deltaproteobacteria bacterium]